MSFWTTTTAWEGVEVARQGGPDRPKEPSEVAEEAGEEAEDPTGRAILTPP